MEEATKFWIWMHVSDEHSPADWKKRFTTLKESGIDGALINFYTGSQLFFESHHLPFQARMLEMILPIAKDIGVEVHSWTIGLRCNLPSVYSQHPEWYSVSREGKSSLEYPPYVPYYQWLCPSRTAVAQFVQTITYELSNFEDLAGVHLDYIRHPDVYLPIGLQPTYNLVQDHEFPEFDFCYDEVCCSKFKEQTGIDLRTLENPAENKAWALFRQNAVKDVVEQAGIPVKLAGKMFSAAVFPTPQMARKMVRQNWDLWGLDMVFPMIYHNFYNEPLSWIEKATREGVAALPKETALYTGLYIPELTPEELPHACEFALKGGAKGIAVFDYAAMKPAHFEAIKAFK